MDDSKDQNASLMERLLAGRSSQDNVSLESGSRRSLFGVLHPLNSSASNNFLTAPDDWVIVDYEADEYNRFENMSLIDFVNRFARVIMQGRELEATANLKYAVLRCQGSRVICCIENGSTVLEAAIDIKSDAWIDDYDKNREFDFRCADDYGPNMPSEPPIDETGRPRDDFKDAAPEPAPKTEPKAIPAELTKDWSGELDGPVRRNKKDVGFSLLEPVAIALGAAAEGAGETKSGYLEKSFLKRLEAERPDLYRAAMRAASEMPKRKPGRPRKPQPSAE